MGFLSNLFSKKNKDLQSISNASPTVSVVNSTADEEAFDYSNLSFDSDGWLTYPDGLKLRNISSVLENFDDEEKVFEIMDETKRILGYNSGELFYSLHDKEGFGWAGGKLSALASVGLWELFSNKLLLIFFCIFDIPPFLGFPPPCIVPTISINSPFNVTTLCLVVP